MSKETARIKRVLSEMGSLIKYKNQWCVGEFNLNYQRYRETLNLLLKNVSEGAEILDVGCSPGYLTFAMHKLGFKVQGVDLNPNQCIKEIRESGIAIKRCNLDNEPLPFEKECFDAVVFTEVIEHLNPWRINSVLQEIKRVLKPYGMLILSTPNLAALENRLFLLIGGIRYLGGE
ncbi:MAG: class I SAM-dependent methyltransferase [Candidatus Bathyarchaeia archaeon]